MKKNIISIIVLAVLLMIFVGSCKRTFFQVTEEMNKNQARQFVVKDAHYRMGKSIAITGSRFELTPADSIVLFIEGQSKVTGVGEEGVMTLDFAETTRFYIVLPIRLSPKKYDTEHRAICEITGNLNYGAGENLFICQNGQVVIDSLKKNNIFGTFRGRYLNTSNKSFMVEGPFEAGLKQ
jgi:hypothetical protein